MLESNVTRRGLLAERNDRGASLVEYALLLSLIAVMAIGAVSYLGLNAEHALKLPAKPLAAAGGCDPALDICS